MPARFSKIMKALREHGIEIVKPNHGSHWKLVGPENTYFVTAHNGPKSEITDQYIKGICRAFGLDETSFRSKL